MKTKSPPDRHEFANEWDEIDYLYDKLLYWLYRRADAEKARAFAERLERVLPKADPDHDAIFGEECRSLVNEAKGNLGEAIKNRKREISLIRQLRRVSRGKPYEHIALKGYGYDDLSDRLILLATLYHDSGALDKAIATLQEAKPLCEKHGIRFEGKGLLQEYQEEKQDAKEGKGTQLK
jgi:hypothetical protein